MKTVACVGMAVADLIVGPLDSFEFRLDVTLVDNVNIKPGGDAANVALNLAAMGVDVSLHSKLGNDLFGKHLMDIYQHKGVDTESLVLSKNHPTAVAIALVQQDGERVFLYQGGAVDALTMDDISVSEVMNKDILHASGFYLLPGLETSGLSELFYTAKQRGKITSLDVGWDSQEVWFSKIESLLPSLTYFLPTLNEAQQIAKKETIQDCAQFFIDKGVEVVVIKAGSEGAFVNDGHHCYWVKGEEVTKVIDTTGAGDGFVSGFLAAIARGYDIAQAVKVANRAGACVVQQYGSSGAITHFEQVDITREYYEEVI
ncbi:carbohydrate kinase family protein [Vibrio sp. FNV 38]|nr:carbohydrate kinase family protein [Vibrio sp. FNV 38]